MAAVARAQPGHEIRKTEHGETPSKLYRLWGDLQLGNPVEIGIATVRLESGSVTARGRKERGGRDADSWVPHGSDKEERGPAVSEKGEGGGALLLVMRVFFFFFFLISFL